MQINGKVAIVTGGLSGLGNAVTKLLISLNAKTYIADLPNDQAHQTAKELNATFLPVDVTSESQIKTSLETLNSQTPHILVNCAGIAVAALTYSSKGPHNFEKFKQTIDVNLNGMFNMIRCVTELMTKNPLEPEGERGVIINTASIASTDGQKGQVAYASSKAAVLGLTLPLARDLAGFGIRVNTICPGIFDTPMLKEVKQNVKEELAKNVLFPKRLGHPDEFAQLVKFLIECPYINGEDIRLDGGLRMI